MADEDRLTVEVDAQAFAESRRQLAKRDREEAAQIGQQRDAVVSAAMREGRISRAQSKSYRRAMDADPDGTHTLLTAAPRAGGLPTNVVPVQEVGTAGGDVTASPADDAAQLAYHERYFPGLRGG